MTERTRIMGHYALAEYMGWASRQVSASMFSRSERRRETGTSRPGDMPPADGYEKRGSNLTPWWFEDTIATWEAGRPSALQAARDLPDGLKVCSKCGETKPLGEYHAYADKRHGGEQRPMAKCKTCRMKVAQAWNERNPERAAAATARWKQKTKRYYKARRYGLTETELEAMEATQQGLCLICREFAEPLFIDHDHKDGHVRGLLCGPCNLGLGAFRDDPVRLLRAIRYLRKTANGVFAPADRDSPGRVA